MPQPQYNTGENERIKFILDLEQRYPVNEWSVNDIHIWPVIRIFLYVELWIEQDRKNKTTTQAQPLPTKSAPVETKISLLQRLIYVLKYLSFRLLPLKKSKAVFASAPGYMEIYKGNMLHRFFDPLRITKPEYGNAYIVFTGKKIIPGIDHQMQIGSFDYVQNLFARRYRSKGFLLNLDKFDAFCAELREYSPVGRRVTREFLQEATATIEKHAFIFKSILQKTHAKEAVSMCYYLDSGEFMGMNLAAHRLGIPSFDIQHGGQGNHHLAYGQFFKVPSSGTYALLPTVFRCWDRASAESIRRWSSLPGVGHRAEIIEHPWLHYLKSTSATPAQQKPVIVYSLQPFQSMVLPQVISGMKLLGNRYAWIFRLHPNMQSRSEELKKLLEDASVMEFVHPMTFNPLSLPETLAIASVHMTRTSGTAIESALMGLPTLLLDKEGVIVYRSYIEAGMAFDCSNADGAMLAENIRSIARSMAG